MTVKAGVAGAGVFGGHHAAKYAALPDVVLAAVYDHHLGQAQALAAPLGAEAFDDFDAFLQAVEAVTVATPADSHETLSLRALKAGRHAYVEKPLAVSQAGAAALLVEASKRDLVLACGHQERVVFEAMGLTAVPERPVRIEAVRRGVPSERNRDVSCVLDLMIHDLDLGATLVGEAKGVRAGGGYEEAWAEVDFGGGASGRFEASRIADRRVRTMRIVYAGGSVEIDFLAPSFVNSTRYALNPDFADTPAGRDPLGTSVAAFIAAVQGRGWPAVSGEEGARALALALLIEAAL